jgi:hypothetical protein
MSALDNSFISAAERGIADPNISHDIYVDAYPQQYPQHPYPQHPYPQHPYPQPQYQPHRYELDPPDIADSFTSGVSYNPAYDGASLWDAVNNKRKWERRRYTCFILGVIVVGVSQCAIIATTAGYIRLASILSLCFTGILCVSIESPEQ